MGGTDMWEGVDFDDSHFVVVDGATDELGAFRELADAVRLAEATGGGTWVRLTPVFDWEGPQVWPTNESSYGLDELAGFGGRHLWRTTSRKVPGTVYEAEVRAGTYFVGDPGYVVRRDLWAEYSGHMGPGLCVETSGGWFVAFATGSDGGVTDLEGNVYEVDTATLGLVPRDLWRDPVDLERMERLGRIVHFETDQKVAWHPGGLLRLGPIVLELDFD